MQDPRGAARVDPPGAMTRLTGWRLAAYAGPGLPLAALALPLYVYVPAFYASEMGLSLALVGQILLAVRLVDAFSDPLVGWLSDRVSGPFGRRRTLFALSLPLTTLAAIMVLAPPEDAGGSYLMGWGIVLSLGTTLALLPYSAWGAELSGDYHERSRIVGMREAAIVAGTLVASATPLVLPWLGLDMGGLTGLALFVGVLLPLTGVVALAFVPEPCDFTRARMRLRAGLAAMRRNGPFLRLAAAFFLNAFATALPASLFLFFVAQRLGAPDLQGPLLFLYFLCGIAGIPIWIGAARRWPKHKVWCAAMGLACIAFVWVPLLGTGDIAPFVAICIVTGFAVGADLVLPNSIQADVIDVDTASSGEQRTGFYFAVWGLVNKLALACGVGLAFPVLQWTGFEAGTDASSEAGLLTLSLLYGLVPVGLKLAALAVMWRFPLGAQEQAGLRRRIEAS